MTRLWYVVSLFFMLTSFLSADENNTNVAATAQRFIEFAGFTWFVKSGGPIGPGPNYWSDSPEDVFVDAQGRLHLKILQKDNVWTCSEIYSTRFTTFGEHRFLVDGYIDRMDKNMVLGLFAYAADDAEIDIEYAKWGNAAQTNVGSYTIQPYTTPGNSFSFVSPLNTSSSTHFFNWQSDVISFASLQGHHVADAPSSDVIQQWQYRGADIPDVSRNLRIHINFWLFQGKAPSDVSVTEVIITDVRLPINTNVEEPRDESPLVPQSMQLYQNYPNPFNESTMIRYNIAETAHVRLIIINSSGKLVSELVNHEQPPNEYRLFWSAKNLSSGLYMCQLMTDHSTEIRKMLLLR